MEIIKEEVKTIVEKYKAYDGKVFDTVDKCREYEKNYKTIVTHGFEQLKKIKVYAADMGLPYSSDDDEAYMICLKNEYELITFNTFLQVVIGEPFIIPIDKLGVPFIVNLGYDRDWASVYYVEEYYNNLLNSAREIANELI